MATDNPSRNTPDRMDFPFVGLAIFARQSALIAMDEFGYVSDVDLMPDGFG
jgi:hypothetical protein